MKILNQEDINALKPYEKLITHAYKYSSIRGASTIISQKIASIIDEKKLNYNWSCSSCIINLYKRAAKMYYEAIERLKEQQEAETEEKKPENEQPQNNEKPIKPTKKKQSKKVESKA